MTSTTALSADDLREANTIVLQVAARRNGGDLEGSYRLVRSGQKLYPGLSIEGCPDVWEYLRVGLLDELGGAAPVSAVPVSAAPVSAVPVSAPAAVRPVSAAPVSSAPVSAAPDPTMTPGPGVHLFGPGHGTIVIEHTVEHGTVMTGGQKFDGISDVIGSQGQRWSWHRTHKYYYLAKSAGYSADVERINWAALALRRAGWTVIVTIHNRAEWSQDKDAPVKRDSAYRQNRLSEVRRAARRQQWVDSAALLAAASGAPVSAAPVSAAPVSAAPRPPQPATPVITMPAYQPMTVEELLTAVLAGDLSALGEARARLNRLAAIDESATPASASIPAEAWDAALVELTTPSVQPEVTLPEQVRVTGNTAEVWFDVTASGKAMREAATTLRVSLNRAVANQYGETGNRPQLSVYRSKAAKAFRVTVTAHEGGDITAIAAKAVEVAGRAAFIAGIREFIEVSTPETVDA